MQADIVIVGGGPPGRPRPSVPRDVGAPRSVERRQDPLDKACGERSCPRAFEGKLLIAADGLASPLRHASGLEAVPCGWRVDRCAWSVQARRASPNGYDF